MLSSVALLFIGLLRVLDSVLAIERPSARDGATVVSGQALIPMRDRFVFSVRRWQKRYIRYIRRGQAHVPGNQGT